MTRLSPTPRFFASRLAGRPHYASTGERYRALLSNFLDLFGQCTFAEIASAERDGSASFRLEREVASLRCLSKAAQRESLTSRAQPVTELSS